MDSIYINSSCYFTHNYQNSSIRYIDNSNAFMLTIINESPEKVNKNKNCKNANNYVDEIYMDEITAKKFIYNISNIIYNF